MKNRTIHIIEALLLLLEVTLISFSSKRLNLPKNTSNPVVENTGKVNEEIIDLSEKNEADIEKAEKNAESLLDRNGDLKNEDHHFYLQLPPNIDQEELYVIQTGKSENEFWINKKSGPMEPNLEIHGYAGQNDSLKHLLLSNYSENMLQESYISLFDGDVCFAYRLFAICRGKMIDDYDYYDRGAYNKFVENLFSTENILCNQELKEEAIESWHALTIKIESDDNELCLCGYLQAVHIE